MGCYLKSNYFLWSIICFLPLIFQFGCRLDDNRIRGRIKNPNVPPVMEPGPNAIVEGAPSHLNNDSDLIAIIYGDGLQKYMYKVGPSANISCSEKDGYSEPTSDWILQSMELWSDGDYSLCVLGLDGDGLEQPLHQATEVSWYRYGGEKATLTVDTDQSVDFNSHREVSIGFQLSKQLPKDIEIDFTVLSDLAEGVDYSVLENRGKAVIRSGQMSTHFNFFVFDNASPRDDSFIRVVVHGVNTPLVQIDESPLVRVDVLDHNRTRVLADSVSLGPEHGCMIAAGRLRCWGQNNNGRLGDGTTARRFSAVDIDSETFYHAVDLGNEHSCGITTTGVLKCWGRNNHHQVGYGSGSQHTVPVIIDAGVTYAHVSAGAQHSCGVTSGGTLKCWGNNNFGQLGDGTLVSKSTPVVIDAGELYKSVYAGSRYSCGLTVSGVAKCWGDNEFGKLGDGTLESRLIPTPVDSSKYFKSISLLREHACAVELDDHHLYCWGRGGQGRLGVGNEDDQTTPVLIDETVGYKRVSAGVAHTCGVTTENSVKCWGNNGAARLGDGTRTHRETPVLINEDELYSTVAAGGGMSCGITQRGILKCWGNASAGRIGDGVDTSTPLPILADPHGDYRTVASGAVHSCAIDAQNQLRCWGPGAFGRVGDGDTVVRFTPTNVDVGVKYQLYSAGGDHSCAITLGGMLKCWGKNEFGQLGDGTTTDQLRPVVIDPGTRYIDVGTGMRHTCGVTESLSLKCWGDNEFGQLGLNDFMPRLTPTLVPGELMWRSVNSYRGYHTCGIDLNNELYCWGRNGQGRLGNGLTEHSPIPVKIDEGTEYKGIHAGFEYTCGVTVDHTLKCWGNNGNRKLGDGTATHRHTPVIIDEGTGYLAPPGMGWGHTCGVTTDHVMKCWGTNMNGRVGDGSGVIQGEPVVIDEGVSYKAAAAGGGVSFGITLDGELKGWGDLREGMGPQSADYSRPSAPRNMLPTLASSDGIYTFNPTVTPLSGRRFSVVVEFLGDLDSNATVSAFYCNQSVAEYCDPSSGDSVSLIRNGAQFDGEIGPLDDGDYAIGDVVKVLIRPSDVDGVFGEYLVNKDVVP